MSKDLKPVVYYLLRRGWYGQAASACEAAMTKKGKEPVSLYWHAFALGMQGQLSDAIRELETFNSRRDLHYAMHVALLYFHRKAVNVDRETVSSLRAELSVSEDVTKEAGLVLAARFLLFTGQHSEARRIAERFAGNGLSNNMSVFELESFLITQWSLVEELCTVWEDSSDQYSTLRDIDTLFRTNSSRCADLQDTDALCLWARVKFLLGGASSHRDADVEVHALLTQCLSLNPGFAFALSDKALLLASAGDWEQALDAAQRAVDLDSENLDALLVFAVHALTQESSPHEAVQKLDDLDRAIQARDKFAWSFSSDCARLLSSVSGRHPRVLEICVRLTERALSLRGVAPSGSEKDSRRDGPSGSYAMAPNPEEEAELLVTLGHVCLMKSSASAVERASKCFRDAQKRDPQNIAAVLGLSMSLVIEGSAEDAQTHLELLALMHDLDQLGHECAFVRALVAMRTSVSCSVDDNNAASLLDKAVVLYERYVEEQSRARCVLMSSALSQGVAPRNTHCNAFAAMRAARPDWALSLALALFSCNAYGNRVVLISASPTAVTAGLAQYTTGPSGEQQEGGPSDVTSNAIRGVGRREGTANSALLLNSLSSVVARHNSSNTSEGDEEGEGEDSLSQNDLSSETQSGLRVLSLCVSLCPAAVSLRIESARALLTHGRTDESVRALRGALTVAPQSVPLRLSLAQCEIVRGRAVAAQRLLEEVQSMDFSVRGATKYRVLRAICAAQQGRTTEAAAELESILSLPEFGFSLSLDARTLKTQSQTPNPLNTQFLSQDPLRLTANDRVQVYISFACVLARERRTQDAQRALSLSKVVWAGTPQEVQVLEAGAVLYCERQEFDAAVRLLDHIPPESQSFQRAQTLKADILLIHLHDREAFTQCFVALTQRYPDSAWCLSLLGDAYLRVLNPEKAIDALERAFRLDPLNGRLRAKIGRALIATHEYHRALEFYESALRDLSLSQGSHNSLSQGSHSGRSERESGREREKERESARTAESLSLDRVSLSHDLARLYLRLRRVDSAVRVLRDALLTTPPLNAPTQDIVALQHDVRTLLLLAIVQESGPSPVESIDTLRQALATQREILSRAKTSLSLSSSVVQVTREKLVLSDILTKLGVACYREERLRESEIALQDALTQDAQCVPAMLALARVHCDKRERDLALSLARRVLSATRGAHAEAALLCAETLLQMIDNDEKMHENAQNAALSSSKKENDNDEDDELPHTALSHNNPDRERAREKERDVSLDAACAPLTTYMRNQPNDYISLAHTIALLRRAGRLRETEELLSAARTADARATTHPGYHYCCGLYARFTNDAGRAIFEFNYARKDAYWGAPALTHMVELYLNPDHEGVWEETATSSPGSSADEEVQRARVTAAEQLLRELRPVAKDEQRLRVLECYTMLAHKTKLQTDRAMQAYAEMLDNDQDYLPAVLGMATGFMIEKNPHKARNLLKRVAKLERRPHDGEDFEKAHLLLAKFCIDKGKADQAQELCRRVLWVNNSCAQAWELLALVFEKDAQYELAADAYQKAWELEFEASATVGFKLAFSLLKCRRLVECVDVCESVLKQYPDYPRISEEILQKALQSLRTNATA